MLNNCRSFYKKILVYILVSVGKLLYDYSWSYWRILVKIQKVLYEDPFIITYGSIGISLYNYFTCGCTGGSLSSYLWFCWMILVLFGGFYWKILV